MVVTLDRDSVPLVFVGAIVLEPPVHADLLQEVRAAPEDSQPRHPVNVVHHAGLDERDPSLNVVLGGGAEEAIVTEERSDSQLPRFVVPETLGVDPPDLDLLGSAGADPSLALWIVVPLVALGLKDRVSHVAVELPVPVKFPVNHVLAVWRDGNPENGERPPAWIKGAIPRPVLWNREWIDNMPCRELWIYKPLRTS